MAACAIGGYYPATTLAARHTVPKVAAGDDVKGLRGGKMLDYWEVSERPFPVVSAIAGGATGASSVGSFLCNVAYCLSV